ESVSILHEKVCDHLLKQPLLHHLSLSFLFPSVSKIHIKLILKLADNVYSSLNGIVNLMIVPSPGLELITNFPFNNSTLSFIPTKPKESNFFFNCSKPMPSSLTTTEILSCITSMITCTVVASACFIAFCIASQ